jgi:ubiquinone/menaquinone biosynthesis C-methylase UbiE
MKDYLEFNQDRWNRMAQKGTRYTTPFSKEKFAELKAKPLEVALTEGKKVPLAWFDKAKGNKLLGLACGGGQQGPLFAVKGYNVTIMDYSEEQLESDRMVAERENVSLKTVNADMTKRFPFEDKIFDIIFCPVSNTYIEDLDFMYGECYRVLKPGGLLMIGYMNPWIYMFDDAAVWDDPAKELVLTHELPYNSRVLEEQGKVKIDPEYGYEFSHTWEGQIRGQLKQGFAMIDFYESRDNVSRLTKYGSNYLANLCVKM